MTPRAFRKKWNELDARQKDIDKKKKALEETFMDEQGVTKVGDIAICPLTKMRLSVQDRRMNAEHPNRNWSQASYHIWLNGNPVNRGKIDKSTRTGIGVQLTVIE